MGSLYRYNNWKKERIAERLSFSSVSASTDDVWGFKIPRPYDIVFRPGYRVPEDLDLGSKDAMWIERELIDKGVSVWDGFCPVALHEIIYECMNYSGANQHIVVRDRRTGKIVPDDRDPKIMAMRPRRESGWGPNAIENHFTELTIWSTFFGLSTTSMIYSDIKYADSRWKSVDSEKRNAFAEQMGIDESRMFAESSRIISDYNAGRLQHPFNPCLFGPMPSRDEDPVRWVRDEDVVINEKRIGYSRDDVQIKEVKLSDFPDFRKPESYFWASVEKAARRKKDRIQKLNEDCFPAYKVTEGDDQAEPNTSATSATASGFGKNPF